MSGETKASFANDVVRARKRVYYEGSDTIYEGYGLSYNYDTTSNITGWSRSSETESTTTTDGYCNEGKYLRVEKPTTTNAPMWAGVVAPGSWCGKAGPMWLEVYVPNGAIVPVYTDKNITALDKMYVENGQYTSIDSGTWQIGTFLETVDRSGTAGLVLARLNLPVEVAEDTVDTTASVGPSAAIWNSIPLNELRNNFSAGILYENDFLGTENWATTEGCVISVTTTGAIASTAVEGGAILLDTAGHTSSDDGLEVQMTQCRVLPTAGRTIAFEARVKMNDATDQYFVGLAATDTTLIASGVLDDVSDKVGFYHEAASTDNKISCVTARADAEDKTADVAANADNTYMTVGFVIDGITTVNFYVNGALVESGALTANVPNAAMCLSLVCKTEGTDVDAELTVDWVRIAQYGSRS